MSQGGRWCWEGTPGPDWGSRLPKGEGFCRALKRSTGKPARIRTMPRLPNSGSWGLSARPIDSVPDPAALLPGPTEEAEQTQARKDQSGRLRDSGTSEVRIEGAGSG